MIEHIKHLVGLLAGLTLATGAMAEDLRPVRIGWQPTTTVEAQVAHALAKTDILERNGLKGEFIMFTYGPAVNEALISGAIDVGFIGDMPSVSLLATGAAVSIVARQSVFRGSILSAASSSIHSLTDLKGRKIYGPYGSSIYRSALNMITESGLQPGRDVEVVNMGFADLADALKAGRIDALFVWDPWIELFVTERLARELKADTSLTMVVAMRDDYVKSGPDVVEGFLKAHKEALLFAATNHSLVNDWFRQPEPARRLSPQIIDTATAYDPAWKAQKLADIRLALSPQEFARYKDIARFAQQLKITPVLAPIEAKTNLEAARKLDAATWPFDPSAVKISR